MKKTITSLFLLAIHLALFTQTPFNLKFNLKTGNLYQMKVINKQNIQTTYNGTPFTTEVNSNIFISYILLSQDKEIMNIEFRFDTIYSKIERRICQTRWSKRSAFFVSVDSAPGSSSSARPRFEGAVWPWSW